MFGGSKYTSTRLHDSAIFTIEDPIEYLIDSVSQSQVDRRHDFTFAQGLRAMLPLNPNNLLLGELRDPESARATIEASTSSRLLMSTIHSYDAVGVVTALRLEISDQEIASSLRIVVAQRLVRRLCSHCRQRPDQKSPSSKAGLRSSTWVPSGCDHCRQLGYNGRVGLFEVWKLNEPIAQ